MSDSPVVNEATPEAAAAAPAPQQATGPDKKEQAQKVLAEILRLMELPARLDIKAAADGGISIAIHFEGEVPGIQQGRRSHLIDSLQVIVNKIINRPGMDRRWVSLGAGAHPEPRPPPGERPRRGAQTQGAPQAAAPAGAPQPGAPMAPQGVTPVAPLPPAAAPAPQAARPAQPQQGQSRGKQRPQGGPPLRGEERTAAAAPRRPEPDEAAMEVSEDPALAAAVRALAEKSAALGRFYGIAAMKQEDRARVLKGASGVAGVKVGVEGEGRSRRVVYTPAKPTPMPKRAIPDYDEDEEA